MTNGVAAVDSITTVSDTIYTVTGLTAGTYNWKIVPKNGTGPSTGCSDFSFTVNALPTVNVTPATSTICEGDTVALTASGATTYSWSPATGLSATTGATVNATPLATTTYSVTGTDDNGCENTANAVIEVNALPGIPTLLPSDTAICEGDTVMLTAGGVVMNLTVLNEDFNGSASGWTTTNTSTGGTPAEAAWTLRPDDYDNGYGPFHSNDATQFYMTDSDAQGSGGTTRTTLVSSTMDLSNLTSASLSFYHHYNSISDSAKVEISTDGTTWSLLQAFTTDIGTPSSFTNQVIDLSSYVGNSTVNIRFRYVSSWGYFWALDNVSVTGTQPVEDYVWTPEAGLYTDPAATTPYTAGSFADTVYSLPTATTSYTVQSVSAAGCNSDTVSVNITVNPIPTISVTTTDNSSCDPATATGTLVISSSAFNDGDTIEVFFNGASQGEYEATSGSVTVDTLVEGNYTDIYVISQTGCNSDTVANATISFTAASTTGVTPSSNEDTATLNTGTTIDYMDPSCLIIATVTASSGDLGVVTTEAVVEASTGNINGMPYLMRHHEIEAENAGVGGTVTLYYLQSEFDDYNANNGTYPDIDPTTLRITAFHSPANAGGEGPNGHDSAMANVELIVPTTVSFNSTASRWEVTFTTSDFSGFYVHTTIADAPLPIKLGDIAAKNNGRENIVTWNTLGEETGDRFELERSIDGRTFAKIADVPAKGFASEYIYHDVNAAVGINYYRLLMINNNGSKDYSKVVKATVVNNNKFEVNAFPNPTLHNVTLNIAGNIAGNAKVIVTDVSGKVVYTLDNVTQNTIEIPMSQLAQGVYILRYTDNENSQSIKITKK